MKIYLMKTLILILYVINLILFPVVSIAENYVYQCDPLSVMTLNGDGYLEQDGLFQSNAKPFSVNRDTGHVIGGLLDNRGMNIYLFDKGSSVQSFKIAAKTTSDVVHAMYLQVDEFIDEEEKPFMGIRSPNSVVITGICE